MNPLIRSWYVCLCVPRGVPLVHAKTRTHSLFRQGYMLYELIPNMPEHRLTPPTEKFAETVSEAGVFHPVLQPQNEGMGEVLGVNSQFPEP